MTRDATNWWGATPITIFVNRSGTNNGTATAYWHINNEFGNKNTASDNRNIYFPLQPGSDYATPDPTNAGAVLGKLSDFIGSDGYSGTLQWGQNDFDSKPIHFYVYNNGQTGFNEDIHFDLYGQDSARNDAWIPVGMVAETTVTILFDDLHPPAGSVDQFHNPDNSINIVSPVPVTSIPLAHPGTDGEIYALAVDGNNNAIIAGHFGTFNGVTRNGIARIRPDGSLDLGFDPRDGVYSQAGDFIGSLVLLPSGKILIGGSFPSFNGVNRNSIARLNGDGSLDTSFDPGLGANGTVWSIAVQDDGKILIAGEFTSINGVARTHIARLNSDGSLDTTFNAEGNAPDGIINSIAVTGNGRIYIGGAFTTLGSQNFNHIARLNSNGSVDNGFNPLAGTDGPVYALALQPNGNILVGGSFHTVEGYELHNLVRLLPSGALDPEFFPGTGTDGSVDSINLQVDGTFYIGGAFTSYNGTRRLGFARIYADGTLDTTFMDTAYNQFAGVFSTSGFGSYFNDPLGVVFASAVQADGNVIIGGSFNQVGGGQYDSEVRPASTNLYLLTEPKRRDAIRNRNNFARLIGGATPGPGNLGLLKDSYSANQSASSLYVGLVRQNGSLGPASANFSVEPGLAQSGVNYAYNSLPPLYWIDWEYHGPSRMHSDGMFGTNTYLDDGYGGVVSYGTTGLPSVNVSIFPNASQTGDMNAKFQMANPVGADQFYLGGEDIPIGLALGRYSAPLKLVDDTHPAGSFGFVSPTFTASSNTVDIGVSRTNGTYGQVKMFYTTNGGTAVLNQDFTFVEPTRTLTFTEGTTFGSFAIRVLASNYVSSVEKTANLIL